MIRKVGRQVGLSCYDKACKLTEQHLTEGTFAQLDRKHLRNILLSIVKPGTVVWGKHLIHAYKNDNNCYVLSFADGTEVSADIVIAADGCRSKLRSIVTDVVPEYTGITVLMGMINNTSVNCPEIHKMVYPESGVIGVVSIHDFVLFIQPRSEHSLDYYFAMKVDESWSSDKSLCDVSDLEKMKLFLAERLKTWGSEAATLLPNTYAYTCLPMYRMRVDGKPWHTYEGIALVGDSAHVMPPFAGIGMNTGFLDAKTLVDNLTDNTGKFASIGEAVRDYAEKMYVYAHIAQEKTASIQDAMIFDNM